MYINRETERGRDIKREREKERDIHISDISKCLYNTIYMYGENDIYIYISIYIYIVFLFLHGSTVYTCTYIYRIISYV